MENFKVAHLRVPGVTQPVDLVIIFVNPSLGRQPPVERAAIAAKLQECAISAGIAGNIAMVWQDVTGSSGFWAPPNQHAFFKSVTYEYLYSQINLTLACG
jgi:hypothetical protein